MLIAAISGSLRTTSYNTGLLRAAASILDGHSVDIIDWSNVPVFNQDNEALGDPPPVADVRSRIAAADALIIATPEYNYSFPGGLKNVLDWMSRSAVKPLNEKPVLVIGASGGNYGTVRAQLALRQVLTHMNAFAMNRPELLVTQARTKFSDDGTLTDLATIEVYTKILQAFVIWTTRMNAPVTTA
jgi:chromate reductase